MSQVHDVASQGWNSSLPVGGCFYRMWSRHHPRLGMPCCFLLLLLASVVLNGLILLFGGGFLAVVGC